MRFIKVFLKIYYGVLDVILKNNVVVEPCGAVVWWLLLLHNLIQLSLNSDSAHVLCRFKHCWQRAGDLEIRLNASQRSTIPQKQFIINSFSSSSLQLTPKNDFLRMVLKDFVKLWVSLLKHLVKRYYIDLLELLTFVYQKKPVLSHMTRSSLQKYFTTVR